MTSNRVPGTDEVMLLPGAIRSTIAAWLEKLETWSDLVVLPTAIAEEMQAGELTMPSKTSLPLAHGRDAGRAQVVDRQLEQVVVAMRC